MLDQSLNGFHCDEFARFGVAPELLKNRSRLLIGRISPPIGPAKQGRLVIQANGRPRVVVGCIPDARGGIFSLFDP